MSVVIGKPKTIQIRQMILLKDRSNKINVLTCKNVQMRQMFLYKSRSNKRNVFIWKSIQLR
jgi:hypothetical protein